VVWLLWGGGGGGLVRGVVRREGGGVGGGGGGGGVGSEWVGSVLVCLWLFECFDKFWSQL